MHRVSYHKNKPAASIWIKVSVFGSYSTLERKKERTVRPVPQTPADVESIEPTWADIEANMETKLDPTGDRSVDQAHFHPNTEEFLACLESVEE